MKIAIPSNAPGGLDATISDHFGQCEVFTLLDLVDGQPGDVETLVNPPHDQGGCLAPVMLLKNAGADALVAGGMGMRPLGSFQQVGIEVFFREDAVTVGQAVKLIAEGKARRFGPAHACGGGGGHHRDGGGCGPH